MLRSEVSITKIIGITGPTGAGKTTALQALVELDAHIIDADAVYHALLESSATLRAELTARFGPSILDGEGRVNRKALGGVVFGDPAALADLNAITHRFILAEIDRQLRRTIVDIISASLREGTDPVPAIGVIKDKNLSLQAERADLLVRSGERNGMMLSCEGRPKPDKMKKNGYEGRV